MVQLSASSLSPGPHARSLIGQAIAAIRTQVRGIAELLAFFVAGAAALWALLSGLLTQARARNDAGPHLNERLSPFPVDD